jgi:hypothetical protein
MRLPNPGSPAAIIQGCTCPVPDNNHGKYSPWPPDGWWTDGNCPVHKIAPKENDDPPVDE